MRPLEIYDKISKRPICIDTGASFNNLLVVDLLKTESKDNTNLASVFEPGDDVTIFVDVTTRKIKDGKWFPSLTCFKIEKYVPQVADDFERQEAQPPASLMANDVQAPIKSDDLPF